MLGHEGRVHDADLPQQELLHRTGRVPGRRGRAEPTKRREDPEGVRVELMLAREVPRHGDAGFLIPSAQRACWIERVSFFSSLFLFLSVYRPIEEGEREGKGKGKGKGKGRVRKFLLPAHVT